MSEKDTKEDLMGCQHLCRAVFQRDLEIEDLEINIEELRKQIKERDRNIKDFEAVKEQIKNDIESNVLKNFIIEFDQLISDNIPVYNYIRKRVSSIEKVRAVFLYTKETLYDLWFIIEENDFNLKHTISEIFCDIVEIFDSILFDIMIQVIDNIDFEKLKNESYKIIYMKQ